MVSNCWQSVKVIKPCVSLRHRSGLETIRENSIRGVFKPLPEKEGILLNFFTCQNISVSRIKVAEPGLCYSRSPLCFHTSSYCFVDWFFFSFLPPHWLCHDRNHLASAKFVTQLHVLRITYGCAKKSNMAACLDGILNHRELYFRRRNAVDSCPRQGLCVNLCAEENVKKTSIWTLNLGEVSRRHWHTFHSLYCLLSLLLFFLS